MIEISTVEFVETSHQYIPHITHVMGVLKMYVKLKVEDFDNIPPEIVRDRIRHEIWFKTYGDLIKPISELQNHALRECKYEHSSRVLELCEEITRLLNYKSNV